MPTQAIVNISLQAFGGLFSIMILLCMSLYRKRRSRLDRLYIRVLLCNICLQLTNILSWICDGRPGLAGRTLVVLSNFLMFLFTYLLVGFFMNYIAAYLEERGGDAKRMVRLCWTLVGLGIALLLVSQWASLFYSIDRQNIYHRGNYYWLSNVVGIGAMLPGLWALLHCRKLLTGTEKAIFSAYYVSAIAAAVSHVSIYGVVSFHILTTLVVSGIYIFIQAEQARIFSENELELEKSRIAVMLSQIQPHFLYNTLTGIMDLCDTGEQNMTSKALEHFAYYLRRNMDSLMDTGLIHFTQEVSHVEDYLYLEKMRFEEKLCIVWDLQFTDFFLPSLTLQPMVENAVRHGITEKANGGTRTIHSEKTDDTVTITVTDTGVGFDITKVKEDDRSHIGIANVESRLQTQCGGTLTIESRPGEGTTVNMILPGKEIFEV